jgi:hypothetical protein
MTPPPSVIVAISKLLVLTCQDAPEFNWRLPRAFGPEGKTAAVEFAQ